MYTFNYTAINDRGRNIRGEIMADNEYDLETRLKEVGLDLIRCREVREKKASPFAKVKLKDMIVFCLHMEQLSRAGVALHEALSDARDATDSPKLKDVISSVYESVKTGTGFSQALAQHPRVFNDVFVGLIAASEQTGNYADAFTTIIDHMKWTADLRRKVRKALAYPAVLGVVLMAVICVLMLFVVPKLVAFITAQGFDLPAHTRALIAFSAFFGEYWYLVLATPVALGMCIFFLYKTSDGFAYKFDAMMLSLPVIGQTIRKINLARFTHFFGVLFSSGIHIPEALLSARDVVGNRVLRESVDLVHRSVIEGNKLTESIRISNQFPNLVVRMFKIGEGNGKIDEALEHINFFYHREVNDAVEAMVGMIQPAMTVVMGSMIFWVIAAVFGPLYQSFSKINY